MSTHTVALQNFPLGQNILPYCRFCSSQVTAELVTLSSLQVLHCTNPHRSCSLKIYGDPHETPEACGYSHFWLHDMAFNNLLTFQVCAFAPPFTFVAWVDHCFRKKKKV